MTRITLSLGSVSSVCSVAWIHVARVFRGQSSARLRIEKHLVNSIPAVRVIGGSSRVISAIRGTSQETICFTRVR